MTLRLLIDGRPLFDDSRFRGIGVYVRALLEHLAKRPELRVQVLARPGTPLPADVELVPVRRMMPGRLSRREHELLLPGEIRRVAPDVFHSTPPEAPWRCSAPWIQTLYDLTPMSTFFMDSPEAGYGRHWAAMARRLKSADAVIAISRHTADDAVSRLGLDPARVHVMPLGVDPFFSPGRSRVDGDPPFILYVGEYGPHKGYQEALAVTARLAAQGHPHRLKIVGRVAPWTAPAIRRLVDASGCPERVDVLGFIPRDDLLDLYRSTALLLVTSRHEGFGLPALEAMATGTPVVAFDNSSLAEVIGDGGVLVADGDVQAMATAVDQLLGGVTGREGLATAALARAALFNWANTARAHADLYAEVAS